MNSYFCRGSITPSSHSSRSAVTSPIIRIDENSVMSSPVIRPIENDFNESSLMSELMAADEQGVCHYLVFLSCADR